VSCRQSLSGTQADVRFLHHIQVFDKWLSDKLKVSFEKISTSIAFKSLPFYIKLAGIYEFPSSIFVE
jgi:hypothetical protein